MIVLTSEDREFHRQARLVSHLLELFLQAQEMRFDDPRMILDSLYHLIDQTVRPILFIITPVQLLTIVQATFTQMDGFDIINHLIFHEVFSEVQEFYDNNPDIRLNAPSSYDVLIQVNDRLHTITAEHPVCLFHLFFFLQTTLNNLH